VLGEKKSGEEKNMAEQKAFKERNPFEAFGLRPELLRAVAEKNYTTPTPIQEKAIPFVLEGKDLLGCAQTGTGKTAAFALPILNRLQETPWKGRGRRPIRALVLTPTRELASQIAESFGAYGRHTALKHAIVFGGVSQHPQAQALERGIDILVATPGRLLDLMSQGLVNLRTVETFVLDEADRMLDMGFIHDIRRIIDQLPGKRQTLFFSATMPGEIRGLADTILRDPVRVAVTPVATPAEAVAHQVHYVEKPEKIALLKHLLDGPSVRNALVFTRTKHGADGVTRQLVRHKVMAEAIHGNKSQNAREKALGRFKRGQTRVLVATDIAARGLDIVDLSHVINFDLPHEPESYVHRIGRTGRAGASGIALSFCSFEERPFLAGIERLIRKHLPVAEAHPYRSNRNPGPPTDLDPRRANGVPVLSMIRADLLFRPGRMDAFPGRSDGRPGRSRRESKWGSGSGSGKQGSRDVERPRHAR
jgi:ATP-dependent RNA helicase RhlE